MSEQIQSPPVTELDAALLIARQDSAQASFFYDAFLNTELFMPVQLEGHTEGSGKQVGNQERFKPLFLNYKTSKVVPLFDRLDRLRNWSSPQPLDYVQLKCHTLLLLFAPEIAIALNLSTEWTYYFPPETLEKLRAVMRPVQAS